MKSQHTRYWWTGLEIQWDNLYSFQHDLQFKWRSITNIEFLLQNNHTERSICFTNDSRDYIGFIQFVQHHYSLGFLYWIACSCSCTTSAGELINCNRNIPVCNIKFTHLITWRLKFHCLWWARIFSTYDMGCAKLTACFLTNNSFITEAAYLSSSESLPFLFLDEVCA